MAALDGSIRNPQDDIAGVALIETWDEPLQGKGTTKSLISYTPKKSQLATRTSPHVRLPKISLSLVRSVCLACDPDGAEYFCRRPIPVA